MKKLAILFLILASCVGKKPELISEEESSLSKQNIKAYMDKILNDSTLYEPGSFDRIKPITLADSCSERSILELNKIFAKLDTQQRISIAMTRNRSNSEWITQASLDTARISNDIKMINKRSDSLSFLSQKNEFIKTIVGYNVNHEFKVNGSTQEHQFILDKNFNVVTVIPRLP